MNAPAVDLVKVQLELELVGVLVDARVGPLGTLVAVVLVVAAKEVAEVVPAVLTLAVRPRIEAVGALEPLPADALAVAADGTAVEQRRQPDVAEPRRLVVDVVLRETGLELDLELPVCLLYTSPSPRDQRGSRMPSSA